MFGINYIKFDSMTHVIRYKNGQVFKEGRGLSFFYFEPNSSISAIPLGSSDVPFIFNEMTSDFQEITVQGQITFKISEPKKLAELLDFTVDRHGDYISEDSEKLDERIINVAQTATASFVRNLDLIRAITCSGELEKTISNVLEKSKNILSLGIEPLSVSILAIKPNPETKRALESKTREFLMKEADFAIYERRNFSVEQERKIKQSELNTEIAIEEKKKEIAEKQMEREVAEAKNDRHIREMKVDADISVETKRKSLIDTQVENEMKASDSNGYSIEAQIKPFRNMDWKLLNALTSNNQDAATNISMAFRELAENAGKIGTLNISPDLLENLITQQNGNRQNNSRKK